jgi:hypothetical protein
MLFSSSSGPDVETVVSIRSFLSPRLPSAGSRLSRRALPAVATPLLDSFLGLEPAPPPRRTASAEAYSTTSLRPSRRWFFGCIKAAVACSALVKSTNAKLVPVSMGTEDSIQNMIWTYPLHRPLSSNVPIRIFRIQGSCGASSPTTSPVGSGAFFGCARCASKRPLIESTVVLNPRLPKKSVGAGGCFCVDSSFRANGVRFFPASSPVIPVILGRPSKLSPGGGYKCKPI